MDERLEPLLESYKAIFETRVPDIGDFEDEFVVINVPVGADDEDEDGRDLQEGGELNEDDLFDELEPWESDNLLPSNINPWSWLEDVYNDRRGISLIDQIRKRVRGVFPGSPSGISQPRSFAPPPNALAFYLPFHRYPKYWGIYLIDVGVRAFTQALLMYLRQQGHSSFSRLEARRIAKMYLYHHEAYHSAVEGFALRAELSARRPFYRTGLRNMLTRPWVAGAPHEETLATAYALRKVRDNLNMTQTKRAAAVDALEDYLGRCSPEYAAGVKYVADEDFIALEQQFKEQAVNQTLRSRVAIAPEAWQLGTYLLMPLLQRNRKYSWICNRSDFRKRKKLALHYFGG